MIGLDRAVKRSTPFVRASVNMSTQIGAFERISSKRFRLYRHRQKEAQRSTGGTANKLSGELAGGYTSFTVFEETTRCGSFRRNLRPVVW